MLESFEKIAAAFATAVTLWQGGRFWWKLIGGRGGLRNPWVSVPIVLAVLGFVAAAAETARIDRVRAGLASPRPEGVSATIVLVGLCIAVIGIGVTFLAGFRRDRRINQLLRVPDMEIDSEVQLDDDDLIRRQAEAPARRPEMEELLTLVERTDGGGGYAWLTADWVRARLDALPAELPWAVSSPEWSSCSRWHRRHTLKRPSTTMPQRTRPRYGTRRSSSFGSSHRR